MRISRSPCDNRNSTDVPTGTPDSTMGDPFVLNGLIEMLRNGQGENITRMVQEGISRVTPRSLHDPIMPSQTPNNMEMNMSSRRVMPSTSQLDTPTPRVASSETNEKETDVPIGASTSIPKTSTISLVTTKGRQEITLLLSSHGEVFKDEMGMRLFHFIYQHAEQLFGNSIQNDWRNQAKEKKAELFKDVIMEFGDPGFDEAFIMSIAQKYTHSKRDNLRTKLKNDRNYPRPAWISDPKIWDELIKDGKFKRKVDKDPNYRASGVGGSNGRLQDTTNATQARVSSIGSHKLGSGGYSSICGGLAHQFQKEAVQEDLNYALLHGSQSLRKHLLDRGEILASGHENEGTQQSNSSSSENGAELGESDELFVAHNNSNIILEPQQETILESEHAGNKNNKEGSISDEQITPTIRMVPHKKRTQRKKI